ncbi:NAM-associated domain-containing protein [Caenorhabditis elegans]|uniref:NAM-associated domain-containing protein n=1 Tax=Caenorhabditis elegans TaxID=6239 RepID=Q17879_CAEEL|nr:NAM-associated domain-containing protein [Caenorhabditis elegans]CAA90433.3 NAM-associated domain-containing protein [Caenorhabditis elegans]|eukprot:NP_496373.2 Ribosomal Protein, Large subunit [Caenorhabditis elegans]
MAPVLKGRKASIAGLKKGRATQARKREEARMRSVDEDATSQVTAAAANPAQAPSASISGNSVQNTVAQQVGASTSVVSAPMSKDDLKKAQEELDKLKWDNIQMEMEIEKFKKENLKKQLEVEKKKREMLDEQLVQLGPMDYL